MINRRGFLGLLAAGAAAIATTTRLAESKIIAPAQEAFTGVVDDWTGGAISWDSKHRVFLAHGGGHSDYSARDLYEFEFLDPHPTWKRLT